MLPRTCLVVPVTERDQHQGPATATVTLVQYGQLGPPIHFTTLSHNNKEQRNEYVRNADR